jgi:opacity protein-like surface antigen
VFILLLIVQSLGATQAGYRLCFPQAVGLPITNPNQSPTIDGVISSDPGWTGAFRYVLGNGTAFPSAAVQGIKDGTHLFLSFEVNNDQTYDDHDLIVLTLSPTGSPSDDVRLHIYPNNKCVSPYVGCSAPKGSGSDPHEVDYWKDSSTWTTGTCNGVTNSSRCPDGKLVNGVQSGVLPAGFVVKVRNSGANNSGNVSWFVEMQILLPTATTFGMYFDVMRANGNTGALTEYPWPSLKASGQTNGIGNVVEKNTPPPADWGNGTRDAAAVCYGVSLEWTDITSNDNAYEIDAVSTPNNNIFTAAIHNSSADSNHCPIAANKITAVFSIANFGLAGSCGTATLDPSCWSKVPVSQDQNQAPLGPATIPAGTLSGSGPPAPCTGTISPGTASISSHPSWNITDTSLINNYRTHPDQCILVDLDSQDFGATILNKSVKRNMLVLTASEVSKTAEISAKGYGPPPMGKTEHTFQLHELRREEILRADPHSAGRSEIGSATNTKDREKRAAISRLTWAIDGCRLTGQYIIIKDQRYEICDDVGAFGALVEHSGATAVARWHTGLQGPGLKSVDGAKDTYQLGVRENAVTSVAMTFAPKEQDESEEHFAAFLDLGAAIPHGALGSAFNTGFSLNAGLEYIVTNRFSAEGIFGYDHFPAKLGTNLGLYQFSANGKLYVTTSGSLRPFINAGLGGYKFRPGSTYFGGNFGGGVLKELNSNWGLKGSYNFHLVNTSGSATKFSTIQGGVRFVF